MAADTGDFLFIPLAGLFQRAAPGRNNIVDRPAILRGAKVRVLRRGVVEDLNFHSQESRIAFQRRANPDAVVRAGFQFEFQSQDKVGVFPFGEQIPAATTSAVYHALFDAVAVTPFADELPAA